MRGTRILLATVAAATATAPAVATADTSGSPATRHAGHRGYDMAATLDIDSNVMRVN